MKPEDVKLGTWVKRTRKSDQVTTSLRFMEAVNELAFILPASEYPSRISIAANLAGGSIETKDYVYQVEEGK